MLTDTGAKTTMKIAGKMKRTIGKISLITNFLAASSALWLLFCRIVAAKILKERAMLPPISSVWVRKVTILRNSSSSSRSAKRDIAARRDTPARISWVINPNSLPIAKPWDSCSLATRTNAESNPSPASTQTTRRSKVSGRVSWISRLLRLALPRTKNMGKKFPKPTPAATKKRF